MKGSFSNATIKLARHNTIKQKYTNVKSIKYFQKNTTKKQKYIFTQNDYKVILQKVSLSNVKIPNA